MEDENFRNECIESYPTISFNPLKIITQVDHYWGYLQTAYIRHMGMKKSSIKYRTLNAYIPNINQLIGFIELSKKLRSLKDLIDYKLINNYFTKNNITFPLIENQSLITLNENLDSFEHPVKDLVTVYLGTPGGNATFKNWVEQYVIPALKTGYRNFDNKYQNIELSNNKFIQALKPNIYTLTPSHNPATVYSLNINMSPRNEEQDFQLQEMQNAFDQLTLDFDTNGVKMPIKDIFYYYNLITYNNKQGESSLTRIFDNYIEYSDTAKEFLNSISELDSQNNSILQLESDEIINWCTPLGSSYNNFNNYVYTFNKNTFEIELLQKQEDEFGNTFGLTPAPKVNSDLILHRPSQADIKEHYIQIDEINYKVTYNFATGKLLKVEGLSKDIIQYIQPKYNPETKEYTLDIDLITKLIKNKLTCSA